MKIGKLRKRTKKDLENLYQQLDSIQRKVVARLDKAMIAVDKAITEVEKLEAENKSNKIKQIAVPVAIEAGKKAKKAKA